ncbi:MAG: type II secretion system protein [Planctomycetes bacterium]|nr:type II secretion system protein [Planctomycetota bacterium]
MTSATGRRLHEQDEASCSFGLGSRRRGARGFTMVEMLVVISILVLLMGLLITAAMRLVLSARIRATEALIHKLTLQLEEYHDKSGEYPADGLDQPVTDAKSGMTIYATACVLQALTQPLQLTRKGPAGFQRTWSEPPIASDFRKENLLPSTVNPDVAEIADSFLWPMHYDRVAEGLNYNFSPQQGEVHLDPPSFHPPDPRMDRASGVREPGQAQNKGRYDLWSHGPHGHPLPEDYKDEYIAETMANWNLEGIQ